MTSARPDPGLSAGTSPEASSGPVMQLLSGALQRWLRSRLQAAETLEIQLHGSAFQLLRGRLAGVTVLARRVIYQDLEIEQVNLRSEPISVQMGNLLKGQPLQLDQRFEIRGTLSFSPEALTRTLAGPRWRALGDALAEQVLGVVPLKQLMIRNDALELSADAVPSGTGVTMETLVDAANGTLVLRSRDGTLEVPLPMDRNITIERADLEGGMVRLHGVALVSP